MVLSNKRGISPVIATVLLVGLAVVIALMIFLWAKSTLAEQYLKFNEPVERSCESVNFEVEIFKDTDEQYKFSIVNKGNVPIYGFRLFEKGAGELKDLGSVQCLSASKIPITLGNGESCSEVVSVVDDETESVLVVPQILAERGDQEVPYTCENSFGDEIDVS